MAPRFVPGAFSHNGRVAASLLPSLVVLMGHGGKPFTAVLMVGNRRSKVPILSLVTVLATGWCHGSVHVGHGRLPGRRI